MDGYRSEGFALLASQADSSSRYRRTSHNARRSAHLGNATDGCAERRSSFGWAACRQHSTLDGHAADALVGPRHLVARDNHVAPGRHLDHLMAIIRTHRPELGQHPASAVAGRSAGCAPEAASGIAPNSGHATSRADRSVDRQRTRSLPPPANYADPYPDNRRPWRAHKSKKRDERSSTTSET